MSLPLWAASNSLVRSSRSGTGSGEQILWRANLADGTSTFKFEVSTYLSNMTTPSMGYSTESSGRVLNVAWPSGNDGHGTKARSRFKSCAGAADGGANHLGVGDRSDVYLKFDLRYPSTADLDTTTSKIAGLGGVPDDKTGWQTNDSPTGISNSWNARVSGYPTSWHRSDKAGPGLVGYLYAHTANGGVTQQQSTNGYGIEIVFASGLNGTGTQFKIVRDTWMPVTMRVKMNTPGVEDGLYEAWVGTTKWVSVTAQWLAEGETTQINQLLMDSFFNTGVAGGTTVQYQNIRLSLTF